MLRRHLEDLTMLPKYYEHDRKRIKEIRQAIKHLQRPNALLHERKVAGMLEQLLTENLWLEKECAEQSRYINQNWYKHHLKPVTGPNRPGPQPPVGGRP
jgi:hypothetical protein